MKKAIKKGKEVYEIMYSRFQNNGDPVDAAARSNRVRGLSFFQGKEPFTAIHLFLAVLEKRKEAFEFLFNAGCPVQNSMRPMKEQPLVQALKDQQEEFVKKLMARVDLTIPYQYDYPKEATIKEYFEKEYIDDAESKACYYRGMGYINSVSKPNYSAQRTLLKKYESWYAS